MENKSDAQKWWVNIGFNKANELRTKYYPGLSMATHFQIEEIYKAENKQQDISTVVENLEDAASKWADDFYDKEDENEYDKWANRKHNFLSGADWQREQDKAIISELLKEVEGIKRNNEKINQHTWETYKIQIELHLKTIELIQIEFLNK